MLSDYFCERVAVSRRDEGGWTIDVSPAPSADFYIDPRLGEGLAWWGRSAEATDIPDARHDDFGWLLSLNDAWTAYAWSEHFGIVGTMPDHLVVLHVDDHNDLMTPRIGIDARVMTDLVTGALVDFTRPATVEAAIRSGAIAQGSFISPFVHLADRVHVRHLCQHRYPDRQGRWALDAVLERDTLLDPTAVRPAVTTRRDDVPERSSYVLTADVDEWTRDLPHGDVLLHVDFDYFNNRFDGDSDWETHTRHHDPDLGDVIDRIRTTVAAVGALGRPVDVVSAALSPGFFPAEMWSTAVEVFAECVEPLTRRR